MNSKNDEPCPFCLKERKLSDFQEYRRGSWILALVLYGVLAVVLALRDATLINALSYMAMFSFVLLVSGGTFSRGLIGGLWGRIVLFALVDDVETGERTYHIHTPRSHDQWLEANNDLNDVSLRQRVLLAVLYGGKLRQFLYPNVFGHIPRRHDWEAAPGSMVYIGERLLLKTKGNIMLDVPWQQALRIAERSLGYERLYAECKDAKNDRDLFGVKLLGTIDWIGNTQHSIGRSKLGQAKRQELEESMEPYRIKHEKRWALAIEKELRDDPVETEPDLGPRAVFPDDPSGFILDEG